MDFVYSNSTCGLITGAIRNDYKFKSTKSCKPDLTIYAVVPRRGLGFGERTSRTISIETGMQNSALAVVLARSIGAPSIASLPGAISATVHSCLGSILAAYWRGVDNRNGEVEEENNLSQVKESPDDYPELLI